MPNYCDAEINVKGYKDNVDAFIQILKNNFNYAEYDGNIPHADGPHFFRIFESAEEYSDIYGVCKISRIWIRCAWSVYCCMMDGPGSYYNDCRDWKKYDWYQGTHLLREAQRLGLYIEVISSEPGMCFQEHIKTNQGILVKDECEDYQEYYIGDWDTKEQYEQEICNIPLTDEEYKYLKDCDMEVYVPYQIIFDPPSREICKNIMCKIAR